MTEPSDTKNGSGADGAETAKPLRWVPQSPEMPASASGKPSRSRRTALAIAACVLAVAVIVVGVVGLVKAQDAKQAESSLRSQLNSLSRHTQSQLRQMGAQVNTIPGRASMVAVQSQLSTQARTLTKLQNRDATYTNCIPEIQTELSGLSINWSINASDVGASSFGITNNSQTSHDCSKLLYGG